MQNPDEAGAPVVNPDEADDASVLAAAKKMALERKLDSDLDSAKLSHRLAGLRAEAFLQDEGNHAKAAEEAGRALDILPVLAKTAVVRGRALLAPLLQRIMAEGTVAPEGDTGFGAQDFKPAWDAFMLAARLDPENAQAKQELETLQSVLMYLENGGGPAP